MMVSMMVMTYERTSGLIQNNETRCFFDETNELE